MEKYLKDIIDELKIIAKTDKSLAKQIENKIVLKIKQNSPELKKGKKIIYELKKDLEERNSIDIVNRSKTIKSNKNNSYISKTSRIGRINRKKALFDMTWIFKQNKDILYDKKIFDYIYKLEKQLKMPEDFDTMQYAKLRGDFVYINKGRLVFHILENGKETKKAIKLEDNSLIVLDKDSILRFLVDSKKLDKGKIRGLGIMPLDSIYYVKDNTLFLWKK